VHPVYPVVIVMFLLMFLTGISLFVIPKFEDFFAEMGLRLPASTAWVMGNLPVFAIMLPVLFLTTLIVLITATVKAFRGRRPDRSSLLSNLADRMKWCTPVVGWFERSYSTARSVNMIRLALESGHTVDQAIAAALKLDLNVCFRWRLWRWLQKVQGGDDVAAAAARCGLGRSIAWAFDTAVHHGAETPAILAHIEAFHRDAYHAMRTIARQVFWPCVVLALAACTGFVVYSMIAPMAAMLQDMVRSMMP
jgi:type IV pilus assembly protein PilC